MDHARTGGTLLNLKFAPSLLDDDGALDRLAHLVRGYNLRFSDKKDAAIAALLK